MCAPGPGSQNTIFIKKESQVFGEMADSRPQAVKVQVDLEHFVPERKKPLEPNKTSGDLSNVTWIQLEDFLTNKTNLSKVT